MVEDDPGVRSFLAEVLGLEGYDVRTAAHGREALGILASWRPLVILLDLMMPVLDGWGFRDEQARDEHLARIPVVLLSAVPDPRREAKELDVAAWLPKPCDLDELLATVRSLIDGA